MAAGFFDNTTGGTISHNHTAVAGDGGVLANLGVTGAMTVTPGPVNVTAEPTATLNLATLEMSAALAMLFGT